MEQKCLVCKSKVYGERPIHGECEIKENERIEGNKYGLVADRIQHMWDSMVGCDKRDDDGRCPDLPAIGCN